MAEERNLGIARAPEMDDDITKAELQRRMEEARESITQTVTEIKDTVANQYQYVKDSVSDALDWREQYRKHPAIWNVGAVGVGLIVGYSLGAAVIPSREEEEDSRYLGYGETDATSDNYAAGEGAFTENRSYASHAITGGAYGSSEYASAPAPSRAAAEPAPDYRPSYSSGYEQAPEADKPGLIDRFKETRAYDRLQEEVGNLGNRFMDELSNTASTIVLPLLFKKIKELVGVDLSNKPQLSGGTGTRETSPTSQSNRQTTTASTTGGRSGAGRDTPPATPGTSATQDKFDRLQEGGTGSVREPGGPESQVRFGSGYDDRYERESQLYARSENRSFSPQPRGEGQTGSTDAGGSSREDSSRGGNYTYDPGRGSNS